MIAAYTGYPMPPDEPRAPRYSSPALVARLDLPGAVAGTAAITGLVLVLTRIEAGGFGDGLALAALAASAVAALSSLPAAPPP